MGVGLAERAEDEPGLLEDGGHRGVHDGADLGVDDGPAGLQQGHPVMRPPADQDPAEVVSAAIRRFVGLAYEDPDFATLVVHLNHADALFVTAVHPAARSAVELGIRSGRFDVADLEVAVTAIVGGSLALMRAIVDGRVGEGAAEAYAASALRALGVPSDEARLIAFGQLVRTD